MDHFIKKDLNKHTIRGASFEDFLESILDFKVSEWSTRVSSLNLPQYDELLSAYKEAEPKIEVDRYEPFAALVNYIISEAENSFSDLKDAKLRIHALGRHNFDTNFDSLRLPDAAASILNDAPKLWAFVLFVIEFKKRAASMKRKSSEPTQDASIKRPRTTSAKTSNNKPANSRQRSSKHNSSKNKTGSRNRSSQNRSVQSAAPGFTDGDNSFSLEDTDDEKPPESRGMRGKPSSDSEVQLANYAIELLSSDEVRAWTMSILIDNNKLTLWYYDRSRAICTAPINFKDSKTQFIFLVIALTKASMSAASIGYHKSFLNKPGYPKSVPDNDGNVFRYLHFARQEFDNSGTLKDKSDVRFTGNHVPDLGIDERTVLRFKYTHGVHRQYTLFGRATRVERIDLGLINENGEFVAGRKHCRLVLKISNQVKTRRLEHEIIQLARTVDPQHTPAVLAFATLAKVLPGDRLASKANLANSDSYEPRQLVFLIMREYQHAWRLVGQCDRLLSVLKQTFICEYELSKCYYFIFLL